MYFEDIALNMTVEITLQVYNEAGDLVLTDVTEAIVKRMPIC